MVDHDRDPAEQVSLGSVAGCAIGPTVRQRGAIWWLSIAGALALTAGTDWRILDLGLPVLAGGAQWWASALLLLAIAALAADSGGGAGTGPRWTITDTGALLAVGAAAAFYRLWGISSYPPPAAFGFEEFQAGGDAYTTLQNWWSLSLEFPLTKLLPAISFRLFGLSSFALRAPFIISGIMAPIFLYLALRRVVQRPAAWAGAMLLATNRWGALAARFADEIFLPVSLVALAAWLLTRVLQERRFVSAFALAVVSSDFFYAYSGYRALPFIGMAGALWLAVTRRGDGWRSVKLCVLALSVWVVTLSPGVLLGWSGGASSFLEAVHRHGEAWGSQHPLAERLATAVDRLRQGWKVFALQGDEFPTLNIPYDPMFDPLSAVLATLAVAAAVWRWHEPSRWLTLAVVGVPFLALALIPVNFNVSRYFVLVVPLFFLTGAFFDDLLPWLGRLGPLLLGVLVVAVAGLNLLALRRVIDSPLVQAGFLIGENTVLAAIHAVPAGSRVILLTTNGNNAFEPSDYRWFTAHAHGGRPDSLTAALTVPVGQGEPVYWITQGGPEAQLLPHLVALSCPEAASKVEDMPTSDATVGVSWIDTPAECHAPAPQGLRGLYRAEANDGRVAESRQLDPALCAYTIPWPLGWKLEDKQIRRLQVEWEGRVVAATPGEYALRLELIGASGWLRAGDQEAQVTAPVETWSSGSLAVRLDREPLPLRVQLDAESGGVPRVRLYWTPPGTAQEEIIPPSQLQPAA